MRALSAVLTLVLAVAVGAAAQGTGLVERIQDLNLTDAQEARIADIRKEHRPKVQEAAKQLTALVKDEVEKIQDVLTPEQKQTLRDLKEDREERREECLAHVVASLKEMDLTDAEMTRIGEIRKEYRPRMVKAMSELAGLLSDEQKQVRVEALKADKKRGEMLASLKLSDAQKEKVVTVAKDVGTFFREEMEKIRDVLAEGQKEKLQDLKAERRERVRDRMAHRIANFKDLKLTDEQLTKLANVREEFRSKIHEAGNALRAAVREEVEMIVAAIKG